MAFTEVQTKALEAKLNARHVRSRSAHGETLSYIEGWHALAEANRIFGFAGWDRETTESRCVWQGQVQGQHAAAYLARVRIRVRAGEAVIVRDGSGAGEGRGATPGEAHENGLKAAETDATKRALSTFGNPFGLALYDPERRQVRGKAPKPVKTAAVVWTLLGADEGRVGEYGTPTEYCAAFRKLVEDATSVEQLDRLRRRNLGTLKELRRALPELMTERGQHYADLVDKLIACRRRALASDGDVAMETRGNGQIVEKSAAPTEPGNNGHAVDKSILPIGEPKRVRDKAHLAFVASQPCLVCGRAPAEAHHLRFAQPRAIARKVSDEWTVPLCALHHRALHQAGDEHRWWQEFRVDPLQAANALWRKS